MKNFNQLWGESGGTGKLISQEKAKIIYQELVKTFNLEGQTAEIGVFQGNTSKFIHTFFPDKIHYCYDTFKGIALADHKIDKHHNGDFACSLDKVKAIVGTKNIVYKEGIFPDTFQEHKELFCFIHSDTDTYAGTKASLDIFANCLVKNGKIFIDDYKWKACPGVEKAVSEFIKINKNFSLQTFLHQCVLTKIVNIKIL